MKKILTCIAGVCLLGGLTAASAQSPTQKTVVANADYDKAGKTKRFFFGDHYRKEWATPVTVDVLDMEHFAGGLTPLKLGGGMQTTSLRLMGADGKEYVLRSVNKDPSKALPQAFSGTFVTDVIQDQISSSNPYAPMAVASLANAAGIFHTNPMLVYVEPSARLDTFNTKFANTLCLLEERPSGNEQHNAGFGYSQKIVNSQKLFENMANDASHQVDEKAFVTARLFDTWIGDWDRHEDQWLWASFKEGNKTIYKPIPRDRDQAFANLDGLIPKIAEQRWAVRKTKNFDYTLKDVEGLNMAGNFIDRSFLTRLSLQDWLHAAEQLQARLTDSAIAAAFTLMPSSISAISGNEVMAKLKQRRSDLKKYASAYYYFLANTVNITGSAKKEWFDVARSGKNETTVTVYTGENNSNTILYQRRFTWPETKEIRLYGLGSEDRFTINGKTNKGALIRVIGGEGMDSIIDHSFVKGLQHKTKVYDPTASVTTTGHETSVYKQIDSLKNNYNRKENRYDWFMPKIVPGYNPDDGLYLGGGFVFQKRKFGVAPYGYEQSAWANYAFATGAYNFGYEGIFKEAVGKWDLYLDAKVNAPNYVFNYFGAGNETVLHTDDKNYNRVRSNQIVLSTALGKQIGQYHNIKTGISYQSIKVEYNENRFVSDKGSQIDSTVFSRKQFASASFAYQFDHTDNPLYPTKGVRFNTSFEYTQNLEESRKQFGKISSSVSGYISVKSLTAAFRIGGAINVSDKYEFYQSNLLGGTTNLRGYRNARFAGKSSLYQNTELRLKLNTASGYYLRGNWGVLAFLDGGRVWIPNESSDTWHTGYGAGIWFLPYNMMAFTATYGISEESKVFVIKAGFLF